MGFGSRGLGFRGSGLRVEGLGFRCRVYFHSLGSRGGHFEHKCLKIILRFKKFESPR